MKAPRKTERGIHTDIGDLNPYPDNLPPLSDADMVIVARQAGIEFHPGSTRFVVCPGEWCHEAATSATDCKIVNLGTRPLIACSQSRCASYCAGSTALMEELIRDYIRLDQIARQWDQDDGTTDRYLDEQRARFEADERAKCEREQDAQTSRSLPNTVNAAAGAAQRGGVHND